MIASERVYREYAGDVYRFALRMTGDASLADDVTPETSVRARTSTTTIRTETLRAYLLTNVCDLWL